MTEQNKQLVGGGSETPNIQEQLTILLQELDLKKQKLKDLEKERESTNLQKRLKEISKLIPQTRKEIGRIFDKTEKLKSEITKVKIKEKLANGENLTSEETMFYHNIGTSSFSNISPSGGRVNPKFDRDLIGY